MGLGLFQRKSSLASELRKKRKMEWELAEADKPYNPAVEKKRGGGFVGAIRGFASSIDYGHVGSMFGNGPNFGESSSRGKKGKRKNSDPFGFNQGGL